jgi:hypothetical protein
MAPIAASPAAGGPLEFAADRRGGGFLRHYVRQLVLPLYDTLCLTGTSVLFVVAFMWMLCRRRLDPQISGWRVGGGLGWRLLEGLVCLPVLAVRGLAWLIRAPFAKR